MSEVTYIPHTTVIRFSDDLLRELLTRDADCNRLTLEVMEPGADGVSSAIVSIDYKDNPLEAERKEVGRLREALGDIVRHQSIVAGSSAPFSAVVQIAEAALDSARGPE